MNKRGKSATLKGHYAPINPDKYSGKTPVVFRSSWELRLMKFFDLNPAIIEWSSESLMINYYDPVSCKNRRYFPDFMILYKDKSGNIIKEVIEVKPSKETAPPKITRRGMNQRYYSEMATHITNIKKWEAAKFYCDKIGANFRLITENEIF